MDEVDSGVVEEDEGRVVLVVELVGEGSDEKDEVLVVSSDDSEEEDDIADEVTGVTVVLEAVTCRLRR